MLTYVTASEGYQVLFRVALTIFKLNESHIHYAADDIQASRILQNTPRGLIDCDAFLEVRRTYLHRHGMAH